MKRYLLIALLCLPSIATAQSLSKLCVVGSSSNSCIPVTSTDPLPVTPSSPTTGGLRNYVLEPAASDNHATIKAGAGQVYAMQIFNNSATVNYIRLYNATTGFNGCNSATNLAWEGQIPASTSGTGFVSSIGNGIAFATGISICVTGAYGQTDTTSATASAISINIGYK